MSNNFIEREQKLSQDVLRQRLPGFFSQILEQLEGVPEFTASPHVSEPLSKILPLRWRRDAIVSSGQYQYEITHLYWAKDLQTLGIWRERYDEEAQAASISLDLQGRKVTRGISPSICYVHYDHYTNDGRTSNYDSEEALEKITALVSDLLQTTP